MKKISWGILSTAKIARQKVVPAMQKGNFCKIEAIASRNLQQAQNTAEALHIPKAYGTYEALLADPEIEAVYIPLPNHLHVEWTVKCLEAGKHVLCEKPIAVTWKDARYLWEEVQKYPDLKVMEAFMYRQHPQWRKAKQLVEEGAIGELKHIHSIFAYHNVDPANVRNQSEIGGGGLLDIGCYCISLARWISERQPLRVFGTIEYDPEFKTDRKVSAILDFGQWTSTFTCSTQMSPYQTVQILGGKGRIEIEIPFNAPSDSPCKMWLQKGSTTQELTFEVCDQYTIQGDLFSQAILKDTAVPTPLTDAVANMRVIEGVTESAKAGCWVSLE